MQAIYSPIWRYSLIESNHQAGVKMCSDLQADDYHGHSAAVVIDIQTNEILYTGNHANTDKFYRAEIQRRCPA